MAAEDDYSVKLIRCSQDARIMGSFAHAPLSQRRSGSSARRNDRQRDIIQILWAKMHMVHSLESFDGPDHDVR